MSIFAAQVRRLVTAIHRPVVDEANATAPAFARIFKEMIIVTDPKKPLPRAGKGTIQRRSAMKLYEDEINKLYVLLNLMVLKDANFLEATRPLRRVPTSRTSCHRSRGTLTVYGIGCLSKLPPSTTMKYRLRPVYSSRASIGKTNLT